MFRTLRAKLIASHSALVLLAVLLLGMASLFIVVRAQRQANLRRNQTLALAIVERIRATPGLQERATELLDRLKREGARLEGHLLLVDAQGRVVLDSGDTYVGQTVPLPKSRLAGTRWMDARRYTFSNGTPVYLVYAALVAPAENVAARYLAVAIETRQIDPPWREILRPLLWVAVVVMALAVVLAVVLAQSIARPVRQMTVAAQEIARGQYDRRIAARGEDEIAQLARAFERMSHEVAHSQQVQRDFLTNISHDLRTPLTSIQGFSQAMLEGAITDERGYRRAAEVIQQEAAGMNQLVQELLALARLEAGQLEVASEPVSLVALARGELVTAAARAEQAGARLVDALPDDLPGVTADPHRLSQALANLLDNAIKYGRMGADILVEGGVQMAGQATSPVAEGIAFGAALDARTWVQIAITNQGEPIAPDELPRIFERFYRGDRSRQRSEGSGLGLAIVRETVLAHGGRLEVHSDAVRGTCFRLWLPVGAMR